MSDRLPLGEKASLRLELKGADALKDPEKIAREVVAMLNAEGGQIWVGIREEEGRAIAVEPIPGAEAWRRSLLDSLVDSIEPSPTHSELKIETVSLTEGVTEGVILRVEVKPGPRRKPYALLRRGGRFYWIRIEDRIRPMNREEIAGAFGAKPTLDDISRAEQKLSGELERLLGEAHRSGAEIFWLRIMPASDWALELDALDSSNLLIDPTLTGNRRTGQNFALAYTLGGRAPQHKTGRLVVGKEGIFELSVHRHDGIEFRAPLKTFHAGAEKGTEMPLYWMALLEFPISLFRLLSKMLDDRTLWEEPVSHETAFLASIALLGLKGWSLRPYTPQSEGWLYFRKEPSFFENPDFLQDKPLHLSARDVRDRPDWCGFRLVRLLYEAFGYGADEMPREFDQQAGRLILPE